MLKITKGDDAVLQIRLKRNGAYLNLEDDDYTFEVKFRKENGSLFTTAVGDFEIVADQDVAANTGKLTLTLAAADTEDFKAGTNLEMIIKVTDGDGLVKHYRKKNLLNIEENEPPK